jgi:hypothetical protein
MILLEETEWDHTKYIADNSSNKEDRIKIIELIRTLPQEPPMTESMIKNIRDSGCSPMDKFLSPFDISTIQEWFCDTYSL